MKALTKQRFAIDFLINNNCLFLGYFMTVNQRVSGSSPEGGAQYSKGFQRIEALFYLYHLHTICILQSI